MPYPASPILQHPGFVAAYPLTHPGGPSTKPPICMARLVGVSTLTHLCDPAPGSVAPSSPPNSSLNRNSEGEPAAPLRHACGHRGRHAAAPEQDRAGREPVAGGPLTSGSEVGVPALMPPQVQEGTGSPSTSARIGHHTSCSKCHTFQRLTPQRNRPPSPP